MPVENNYTEEILGPPPAGMISRGMLVIVVCLVILMLCAFLIRVPRIIRGRIEIHRTNAWSEIRAKHDARIAGVFVCNGDTVAKGDTLMLFEDQLTFHEFLLLESFHDKLTACLENEDSLSLQSINISWYRRKTVFDEEISILQNKLEELSRRMQKKEIAIDRNEFNALIEKTGEVLARQMNRVELLEEESILRQKNMQRMDSLHRAKVIPETELEKQKLVLLSGRRALEAAFAMQSEQEHRIQSLKKELHEIERKQNEEIQNTLYDIKKGTASLGEKLALWEKKNLVIAPLGGTVIYTSYWSRGQCLNAGESLLSILPDRPGDMLGKLVLPAKGNGQIREGQTVRISLDNLPVSEYGYFWGRIRSASGKPEGGQYQAEVGLELSEENRKYSDVEKLRFAEGVAEVILEEQSLIGMWLGDFR